MRSASTPPARSTERTGTVRRSDHTPWWSGLLVFVVALAIRLFFLTLIPRDALQPSTDWELDSIAMSLATTGEFANPYVVPTGPTAHLPPIPPAILESSGSCSCSRVRPYWDWSVSPALPVVFGLRRLRPG